MTSPSSISRRMRDALVRSQQGDHEGALVHLFPAMDKAAKRRRPKAGVGERIRGFLEDEEGLITMIAVGVFMRGNKFDGLTLPEVIYRFGRTSIMHEGELDSRLRISTDGTLRAGGPVWFIPTSFITAMCIAVMAAPECSSETLDIDAEVDILGTAWQLNDLWGAADRLKAQLATKLPVPDPFGQRRKS